MPHLHEQELHCSDCGSVAEVPVCCGRDMEHDGHLFFCPLCGRERKVPVCCGKEMQIRKTLKKLKGELFGYPV